MFKAIFLLPLLVSLSSGELREQDALCGPSDACYAVFYKRHSFLESWRACRERGGNLATVKNSQEAALVEQLLTSSTGSRGDKDLLKLRLWIGLQRQPRQCAPQKPLRGFTWTTGDQDTAFTNWAHQALTVGPPSSCSAPRCVALGLGYGKPEDDFKWLEGSCTLPVDGFICKFRYQGMCAALTESIVRYSVPFGYQGTWLDRLPFGTVAVVSCEGQQQDVSVLCMLKEDGTVGWNMDEPLCQPPYIRQCQGCQHLCGDGGVCSCHDGYRLQPDGRSCKPEDEISFEDHDLDKGCPCQYQCVGYSGMDKGYQCICPEGYQLANDGLHCEDIDECEEGDEGPCDSICQNTPGSYVCSCDLGYAISEDEPGHCVDVDECRIAHVCQQMCVNYDGGFECFCSEGYELDGDRVSCRLTGYDPNPPVTTSEERSEEHTDEWYPDENGGSLEDRFESEWENTGTSNVGREERWDLIDVVEEEDETTTKDETVMKTPSSFEMWLQEETTVFPTRDEQTSTLHFVLLNSEKDGKISESASRWPVQKTTLPIQLQKDITMNVQTTTPTLFSMSSTVAARFSPEKSPSEKTKVTTLLEAKVTSSISSTTESSTTQSSWVFTKSSSPASNWLVSNPTRDMQEVVPNKDLPSILPDDNDPKDAVVISSAPPSTSSIPQESRGKRDNRWLIVALLVPLCVFLVIMLAMGIVYCTRCGGETKPRSVTDCYHWVTGGGPEKGVPPTVVETPSYQASV
ncbi:endosialin [Spea bombifrons]|uniref:endosialin n=1 Tax=Spea bombifrons TaxID=233779 RepID=UPI00234B021F|nr:endosialin [Spea bombifrons]